MFPETECLPLTSRLFDTLESAPGWSRTVRALDRIYVRRFRSKAGSKGNGFPSYVDYQRRSGVVLIICKGNICRSPFLAHYLRSVCEDRSITFESAGLRARREAVSPRAAIESAAELGIHLEAHRAKPLRDEDVELADLIVGMEPIHHLEFCLRYSRWRRKFMLLRAVEETPDSLRLPDPYGGSITTFHECYDLLARDGQKLLGAMGIQKKGDLF